MKKYNFCEIAENYKTYQNSLETVYLECPNCKKKYAFPFKEISVSSFFNKNLHIFQIVYTCPECFSTVCYVVRKNTWNQYVNTYLVFPDDNLKEKEWPKYINEKIREDYKTIVSVLDIDPSIAVSTGRKALERIILTKWPDVVKAERKDKDRLPDLAEMIRYVEKNKLYDDYDLLKQIKNIGNNSIHVFSIDKDIKFTKDDAKLVISIIELLINELFIKPEEKSELKSKIAELAQNTKVEKDNLESETMNKDQSTVLLDK